MMRLATTRLATRLATDGSATTHSATKCERIQKKMYCMNRVMLPMLKKSLQSSGIGIIVLNKDSLHMFHYRCINKRVFWEDLQQYLVYMDFHQLYLLLVKSLEQLKTMNIWDSTITFSQMLEWTKIFVGIKDHSNMPAETSNAYDAEYKKLCDILGANFNCSARLK